MPNETDRINVAIYPAPEIGPGISRADISGSGEYDLTRLDWDRYGRFRRVSALIADDFPGAAGLTVLDVGGDIGFFAPFVPDHETYVADPRTTGGDGTGLQLPADAVDIVVSFDTLEHIPGRDRAAFLKELTRVARRAVYITYPRAASRDAQWLVWQLTRNQYLEDHFRMGLPDDDEMSAIFAGLGCDAVLHPHSYLGSFIAMMLVLHKASEDDFLRLNQFFNRNYADGETFEPALRSIWQVRLAPASG